MLGIVELSHGDYTTPTSSFPRGPTVGALQRLVAEEHVDHGYAGYWEAATLSVQTHFRVRVHPVVPCRAGACPSGLHGIGAWYQPRPDGRPAQLLRDRRDYDRRRDAAAARGVGAAGRARHPRQLDIFVYNYDLVTRLGPAG